MSGRDDTWRMGMRHGGYANPWVAIVHNESTVTPRAFADLREGESTEARSADAWCRGLGPRRTSAVYRRSNDGGRKRLGNGSSI